MVELDEAQGRLLRLALTNERVEIMKGIEESAKQILEDQPVINQEIDKRVTLIKFAELYPPDPTCQEIITLEQIETNWGDIKPKEQAIVITSRVFTPSTVGYIAVTILKDLPMKLLKQFIRV